MAAPLVIQTLPSFDELVALAELNPEAFDQLRKDKCEEMIASASECMQDRLWAQQSHIERVIGHCKNPNHANVVLMEELVSQMCKFQSALDTDTLYEQEATDGQNVVDINEWR